ncbi:bifunctional DNA primase/polymerase [Kribbella sp. NPDC058245]|uniref:bifunctional DNA primase/polymerase n=1 Tax=Kribbella sp. NPDC058245 TaxID=3346399 RepID=UPI0036E627E9
MTTPMMAAALDAAGRGWPVFMLGRSKRPVANCDDCHDNPHDPANCGHLTCHGFYAATTDPDCVAAIVDAVPGGQLAVRTGAASGLVVVDVDPAHGGADSLAELVRCQLVPRTLWVLTGSLGQHLYYRHPGHEIASRPMPNRRGIDIKADGGYVVLPPSIHHRTHRPYQWAADRTEPVEMPPPLIDACQPPAPAKSPVVRPEAPTRSAGGISHPQRLLTSHLNAVRNAPEGRRRTTLYGASRGIARMVLAGAIDQGEAVAVLTAVGQEVEQTARDITAAITGGFRDEGIAA